MNIGHSRIDEINSTEWNARGIKVYVKRDDLIHPVVSGNKWRKLKYNIELCNSQKKRGILTFGGAYSNHLVATAAACKISGLISIGMVRGDELNEHSNPTLEKCVSLGMKLRFLSRDEYNLRGDKEYHEKIGAEYRSMHLIPEGGSNYYGIIGCQEIMSEININVDDIFVAQGTTTTSCGVLMSLKKHQRLHVVPVLKGFDSLSEMRTLYRKSGIDAELIDQLFDQVKVHSEFHFGGYGKCPKDLVDFILSFYQEHQLKLDPIYTGKAMNCLIEKIKNPKFDGKSILFIHTGGLQGAGGIINFND